MVNYGFWKELRAPIVGLSPMDGVTDFVMRFVTKKYGNPDLIYTEFVSAEGLSRNYERLRVILNYDPSERPVVAQLFGKDPEAFRKSAKIVMEMGLDGVDINMGCPARKVAEKGSGGGLIGDYDLAERIIKATKEGVENKIPVSVKTRIGKMGFEREWFEFLAKQNLAAIAVHGRTVKQGYTGLADWNVLAGVGRILKSGDGDVLVLGNGDLGSRQELVLKVEESGLDGGLIGRAAWGNPWVFADRQPSEKERLDLMIEMSKKYEEVNEGKPFFPMRKHLVWLAKTIVDASELKKKLVLTNSANEVESVVADFNCKKC